MKIIFLKIHSIMYVVVSCLNIFILNQMNRKAEIHRGENVVTFTVVTVNMTIFF